MKKIKPGLIFFGKGEIWSWNFDKIPKKFFGTQTVTIWALLDRQRPPIFNPASSEYVHRWGLPPGGPRDGAASKSCFFIVNVIDIRQ